MDSENTVIHERVFVTVKTYPTLSNTYGELVCTAGLREDGSWIRLYPVPFRLQDNENKYKKYQWIELDVRKRDPKKDHRKESYSPVNIEEIKPGEFLEPDDIRRREIIHRSKIYTKLSDLTDGNKRERISLATFRPSCVKRMKVEPCEKIWDPKKLDRAMRAIQQETLFDSESLKELRKAFTPATKIPFHFKYEFEDENGRESCLMVEDWELGMLFLNCCKKEGEKKAVEKTVQKYESFINNPDLLFFLGTSWRYHSISDNPYIIIGVYRQSPKMKDVLPKEKQPTLF